MYERVYRAERLSQYGHVTFVPILSLGVLRFIVPALKKAS